MEEKILEIAKYVQFNAEAEAKAVFDYTEMIKFVVASDIEEETKKKVVDIISELIADELNHETKLHELYTSLVGIEQNKD